MMIFGILKQTRYTLQTLLKLSENNDNLPNVFIVITRTNKRINNLVTHNNNHSNKTIYLKVLTKNDVL